MADFKTANLCGTSLELTSILSQIDDIFGDILAGLEDVAGTVISALESAMESLASALGSLIPDISDLIPDISFQAGVEALLGFIKGTAQYAAKLAELILQFGEAILGAGLHIFDLIADAAAGLLKGLDPCTLIPEFKFNGTDARETANNIGNASVAAVNEKKASESKPNLGTSYTITKPVGLVGIRKAGESTFTKELLEGVTKLNVPFSSSFVNNRLEANRNADVKFYPNGDAYIEEGSYKISLLKDAAGIWYLN